MVVRLHLQWRKIAEGPDRNMPCSSHTDLAGAEIAAAIALRIFFPQPHRSVLSSALFGAVAATANAKRILLPPSTVKRFISAHDSQRTIMTRSEILQKFIGGRA